MEKSLRAALNQLKPTTSIVLAALFDPVCFIGLSLHLHANILNYHPIIGTSKVMEL